MDLFQPIHWSNSSLPRSLGFLDFKLVGKAKLAALAESLDLFCPVRSPRLSNSINLGPSKQPGFETGSQQNPGLSNKGVGSMESRSQEPLRKRAPTARLGIAFVASPQGSQSKRSASTRLAPVSSCSSAQRLPSARHPAEIWVKVKAPGIGPRVLVHVSMFQFGYLFFGAFCQGMLGI